MRYPGQKSCCFKCPKRTATCHGNCPDYALEDLENKKRLEKEVKEIRSREAAHTPAFQRRAREYIMSKK